MTLSETVSLLVALAGVAFMIWWLFWPLLRDVRNRRRARAGLPVLAEEMGLKHAKGDTAVALGTYRGSMDGHRIAIKPDETSVEISQKGSAGQRQVWRRAMKGADGSCDHGNGGSECPVRPLRWPIRPRDPSRSGGP